MKKKPVKIKLDLNLKTLSFLRRVAKLADTDQDTVISVLLASDIVGEEMRREDPTKKTRAKEKK